MTTRSMSASQFRVDEGYVGRNCGHLLLVSPIVIIGLGQLAAGLVGPRLGQSVWGLLSLGHWATLGALIAWGGGKKAVVRWLQPSRGSQLWSLGAVAFAVVSMLWMFVLNWQLLLHPQVLLFTVPFVLINPCLEEGYWRGLVIDAAGCWPKWLAVLYSGTVSAINLLWLMVVVVAARNPAVGVYQFVLGLIMGIVYVQTRSLRWPIAAHGLVNRLSLTVARFMNLYVPGPQTWENAAQMPAEWRVSHSLPQT